MNTEDEKNKCQCIVETENFRAFASSNSFSFHYRNESGSWRKGKFNDNNVTIAFLIELLEEMLKAKNRGGGYRTFPNDWPDKW